MRNKRFLGTCILTLLCAVLWSNPPAAAEEPVGQCDEDTDCDDGNPCTDDDCVDNKCVNTPVKDGTACDDGLFCNGEETCTAGVCGGSTGDPCPGPDGDHHCAESCDEEMGNCAALDPDGSACDDDDDCFESSICTLM